MSFFIASRWFSLEGGQVWIIYFLFLGIKIFFFGRMGLYHAILRFAGLPLAITILKASTLATLLCALIIYFPSLKTMPIGFMVTDYLVTTFLVGLIRFSPRYFSESLKSGGTKRIIIYGAGELGEEVARKLLKNPGEYRLVGFIDDEMSKIGKRVHNLPIFGPISDLQIIVRRQRISELIIAISSLEGEKVRHITRECRRNNIFCRIAPTFSDVLRKKDVDIKKIDISDLLKREPKDLDEQKLQQFIRDKIILITGAGGSIGSELSRQCVRYGAKKLILIDHSEFNLYSLQEEFSNVSLPVRFYLMNILKSGDLEQVMQRENPSIFFHAAAYKHVPIVEENSFEGIQNNVRGTMETALLAEKHGIDKYVLISTDKAVRPTSIMGASKRVAELYIQNLNSRSKTEFIAVRFGNVLGSSGSVIPKFIDQINKGGPVTVTHPEVTRYFMLISEAVQLVLQAASIGFGGEIFILNMGKPVRILEMAEDLIFLSGREPYKDIPIEFTGLRPGEKLYEEILIDEAEKKTQYENITVARTISVQWNRLNSEISRLLYHADTKDYGEMLKTIKLLVPEFQHTKLQMPENDLVHNVIPLR